MNESAAIDTTTITANNDGDTAITALQQELAATKDQLLRAVAETENIRKRTEREKDDFAKYAISSFARDVLGVADNLRRAIESIKPEERSSIETFLSGIEMTETMLLAALQKHGVKKVGAVGEKFDPNFHQAMMEVDHPGEPGAIVTLLQAGYVIHDRLLRPALVAVAKRTGETKPSVDTVA